MDTPKRICSVPQCGNAWYARKMCRKHYDRLRVHGRVDDAALSRAPAGKAREFLFNAAGSATDECIVWPFFKDKHGYGRVFYQGKPWSAHRLSLVLADGEPSDDSLVAAHAPVVCHNPSCVNPRHLRWATRQENNDDRVADGTDPDRKLNEAAVLDIRNSDLSPKALAEAYSVSVNTIYDVRSGQRWAWVK